MNKKNNLALFMLLVIGLISLLALNLSAQNKVSAENNQPQTVKAENDVLKNYVDISSLAMNKRPKAFSGLSARDKANLFKLHLAVQFVKRPYLTKEQKNVILESISMISPDSYNEENSEKQNKAQQDASVIEQKAKTMFSRQEGAEIFASLGGSKEDVEFLQKYSDLVLLPSMSDRKEQFVNGSNTDKSNFWKTQMAIHLAKNSTLTETQRKFILLVIDFVKPEIYSVSDDTDEWKKLDNAVQKITQQAVELFGKENGAKIFALYGEITQSTLDPRPDCNCSYNSDWCWLYNCTSNVCNQVPGCGTLGLYKCTGRCFVVGP